MTIGSKKLFSALGRAAAAAATLLTLLLLTGCSDEQETRADDTSDSIFIKRLVLNPNLMPRKDVTTGKAMPITSLRQDELSISGIAPGSYGAVGGAYGTGHTDAQGRARGKDADYVDKADVYWKLNWVRRHLSEVPLPEDFEKALKLSREELETTVHDAHYKLGDDALTHLEAGYKHFKAAQFLRLGERQYLSHPLCIGQRGGAAVSGAGRAGGSARRTRCSSDLFGAAAVRCQRPERWA